MGMDERPDAPVRARNGVSEPSPSSLEDNVPLKSVISISTICTLMFPSLFCLTSLSGCRHPLPFRYKESRDHKNHPRDLYAGSELKGVHYNVTVGTWDLKGVVVRENRRRLWLHFRCERQMNER
jgi:hypothetical protein